MLYDPKWERPTKVDPKSVEGLIAWLETMPSDGTYNWHDCKGGCLIGIYGQAIGVDWHDIHDYFYKLEDLRIAGDKPWTFGGALDRARKFAATR